MVSICSRLGTERFLDPVHLDEEDGAGVGWVAGVDGRLHCLHGRLVHHLQGGRQDALADDGRDGLAGLIDLVEDGEERDGGRRQGESRTMILVTTARVPSEPMTTPRRS